MANSASNSGADSLTFSSSSKEYPVAPEGVHHIVVNRALFAVEPNKFDASKGDQPKLKMMLQSKQTYEDDDGEKRAYNLFKNFTISDHKKSGMYSFFQSVMGMEVPLNDKKQIELRRTLEKMDNGDERVHLPQFEGLTFSVIVKHETREDGSTRDYVDSIFANPEEKKTNAELFLSFRE